MMQKKGAIELSVTAIVVLILAVVMLGLGLGFVRGMFGKVSQSFEEQIGAEPEPVEATADNPLTLSRAKLIARAKETIVIKVSAFNPTATDWTDTIKPDVSCVTSGLLTATSSGKAVASGKSANYNVILEVKGAAAKGIDVCKIIMGTGADAISEEFVVEIK